MEYSMQDYLKKALLDTQERVRDYMSFAHRTDDPAVRALLQAHAEVEGLHAGDLKALIDSDDSKGDRRHDR